MGRFPIGSLAPFTSIRPSLLVNGPFNTSGDWGQAYVLAHPRNPRAELVCDFHAKVQTPAGAFRYLVTITNAGPFGTVVDVDF
jgi:hypothetical protein